MTKKKKIYYLIADYQGIPEGTVGTKTKDYYEFSHNTRTVQLAVKYATNIVGNK
jgi:hypothetical protein